MKSVWRIMSLSRSVSTVGLGLGVFLMALPGFSQSESGQYALILRDPPVSSRFTSRQAMRSVEAESYRKQIVSAQETLRAAAQAKSFLVTGSADTVLNAVFVAAAGNHMAEMRALPGVLAVIPMRNVHPLLNAATALMNAPAAWTALGGQGNAGLGMKVGVLDYGIDQTHPAFQDSSLPKLAGFPRCSGFTGDCGSFTNNKVIVARSYTSLIAPGSDPATSRPDDFTPRDREGHGTAVASCIAANNATGTVTISGMAPKAYLGNYKIFGSPLVNDFTPESVIIQALNDAVGDGMDVINMSAGISALTGPLDTGAACGLAAGAPCDPMATAFENAAKAGTIIVLAAGNSGEDGNNFPTLNSIATPADAPSVIAVGASWNSHFFTETVSVAGGPQNIAAELGDNFFPFGAISAPLIDVATLGGGNDGLACSGLPAGSLNGAFALIERGTCQFADKETNALDAGAVGVVFYMADASDLISPTGLSGSEPVAMISNSDGTALKSFVAANLGSVAIIDPAGAENIDTADQDLLASFSSFGPTVGNVTQGDAAIKPDLVAVGTDLYMAAQNYDPNGGQYSVTRFAAAAGTSFASPITAGAAALVKQKHPTWTAAQVKSALVNTANQDVTTDDQFDLVDVEWLGAGKLDAGAAVGATVLANPVSLSFGVLASAPAGVSRQITLTNTGSGSVNLTVAVAAGAASFTGNLTPGIAPTLDKATLALAAGATGTVTVSLSGTLPAPGSYSGAVTFQGTGVSIRVPYLYLVGGGAVGNYNIIPLAGNSFFFEGIVGQPPADPLNPSRPNSLAVKLVDAAGVPVAGAPVSFAATPSGSVTFQNTASTTNSYGIAATDMTIAQTGNLTVDVTAGGQKLINPATGFGRVQPTIPAGSVVNAANFQSPIAPGSYVTIFGTGLSDPGFVDPAITAILPLVIDGVTVSFDVPSANISVPGHIVFVSEGQVNVQVPWELQGQSSVKVKVTIDSFSFGNVVDVPVADATPAFFEGNGNVAARDAITFTQILPANPAKAGEIVALFANGLGPLNNQPASGDPALGLPLATTKNTPTVTIGNKDAPVSFSGLTPGLPGLYQLNVTVPAGLTPGNQPVVVTIGGLSSKASNLAVQ